MTTNTKGIYLSILTAVISGVSIFVNKFAVDAIKPALYFTSIKNIGVAILIFAILVATKEWKTIRKLSNKQVTQLLAIGIVGGSIPFYLFFTGLALTPAVNAAIIHKTLVFWVILLAVPFLKEKVTKNQLIAVILLFGGNIFVGGFKGFTFSRGELMILAATILWAIENVIAKKVLKDVGANIVTAFRMGIGSLVLMGVTFLTVPQVFQKSLTLTNTQLFWVVLTILFLLAYTTTWYRALKFTSAITVTSILVSSTIVTNLLSAIFVTHSWNATLTIQTLLMSAGLIVLTKVTPAKRHAGVTFEAN